MVKAVGVPMDTGRGFCLACFTAEYPVPVLEHVDKYSLEGGPQGDD